MMRNAGPITAMLTSLTMVGLRGRDEVANMTGRVPKP